MVSPAWAKESGSAVNEEDITAFADKEVAEMIFENNSVVGIKPAEVEFRPAPH